MSKPSPRQPVPGPGLVRLAIPNKGRIAGPINELIEKSGLHLAEGGSDRRLITRTRDPNVEILFARPIDIPEYVASGVADLGITGKDMVMERGSVVEEVLDLQTGKATLVVAVPEESDVETVADLAGAKVATEFPAITRAFFDRHNVAVTIVTVGGACEATPHLGIADAIVDLSSSGTTLRTNHLRVIDEVLTSTTVLVANPASLTAKREKIDELVLALESVIRAKGQCYLMMNVHRSALADVREVLPGLSGPTVMEVASDQNLVAVHAVVKEERVYQLINQVKRAGAKDILVMPIERIIR
ncbi:ATP phosphoribosyltransferase [Methanoculleus sp. Afa-1]|uniref:ATP phosphoribosyltransferase n=1 Tax=Methanoculleus formosensis TaxID=2590886 RepID=A0A9E5DEQ7_9EURY|nr:ATP phosphoribosyltransferase [Methanoculleus sp. Afa-1]MCT8337994.1 ATP phosphoribosyltransferase [Methanoculleus sp. Afa-1]